MKLREQEEGRPAFLQRGTEDSRAKGFDRLTKRATDRKGDTGNLRDNQHARFG
jgi:hypothetical protein